MWVSMLVWGSVSQFFLANNVDLGLQVVGVPYQWSQFMSWAEPVAFEFRLGRGLPGS